MLAGDAERLEKNVVDIPRSASASAPAPAPATPSAVVATPLPPFLPPSSAQTPQHSCRRPRATSPAPLLLSSHHPGPPPQRFDRDLFRALHPSAVALRGHPYQRGGIRRNVTSPDGALGSRRVLLRGSPPRAYDASPRPHLAPPTSEDRLFRCYEEEVEEDGDRRAFCEADGGGFVRNVFRAGDHLGSGGREPRQLRHTEDHGFPRALRRQQSAPAGEHHQHHQHRLQQPQQQQQQQQHRHQEPQQQQQQQQQQSSRPRVSRSVSVTQTIKNYVKRSTSGFFGVDEDAEPSLRQRWLERRLRLASKQYGELRDDSNEVDAGPLAVSEGRHHSWRRQTSRNTEVSQATTTLSRQPNQRKDSVAQLTWDGLTFLATTMSMRRRKRRTSQGPEHRCSFRRPSVGFDDSVFAVSSEASSALGNGAFAMPDVQMPEEPLDDEVFFDRPCSPCSPRRPPSPASGISADREDDDDEDDDMSCVSVIAPHHREGTVCWKEPPLSRPVGGWRQSTAPSDVSTTVGMRRIWDRVLRQIPDHSDRRQYGMGLVGRILKRSFRRERITSDVKEQLDHLDDHRPYFTYWVTTVQILMTIVTLAMYGFGPIGFEQTERSGLVYVTSELELQVDYLEPDNFWIGPRAADLVRLGAKFSPCMRWDRNVMTRINRDRAMERDTACCIRNDNSNCIQASRDECSTTISTWKKWSSDNTGPGGRISGSVCGQDPNYCSDPPSVPPYNWPDDITKWPICRRRVQSELSRATHEHMACEVIGHPCCYGILGECQITTRDYCSFVKGFYHEEAALCSQVSCMDDICGMMAFYSEDVPDQFYRLWTSLFLHAGIVHLLITIAVQFTLMRDLEKLVGPVRIGLVYLVSGVAGNLASAIFVPYRAEVGPAGSQFGLLACLIVEVVHCWPLLKRPYAALVKMLVVVLGLFLVGLLPWVDNYAHLVGFVFGLLLSYALLPFVSFGAYDRRKKVALIWACVVLVMGLFAVLLLFFYVHPIYECDVCKYLTCIPFTENFCASQGINITSRRRL